MKLLTVNQMVNAEKAADANGISYAQLMENAGRQTAEAIIERMPVEGKSVLIMVGPGNNGGDGLVAGRYLAEAGADVAFYLFKPRDPEKDVNFAKVQEMGLLVLDATFDQRFRVLRTRLTITDILIDGLLGTGVSRPISGDLADLMKQLQIGIQARRAEATEDSRSKLIPLTSKRQSLHHSITPSLNSLYITAIDCPSGLNCNSGALDPLTVTADLTVTYAAPKWGHFLFPGAGACGELVVADIDIDEQLPEIAEVQVEVVTQEMARGLVKKRPLDGHKGTFGKVCIAAGCDQYRGAPLLSAKGAFRAGAGLVALFVPNGLRDIATGQLPEATYPQVDEADVLGKSAAQKLLDSASRYSAILIGPGLGNADEFLLAFLEGYGKVGEKRPLLIDADGLNILSRQDNWPALLPPNTVLTPHPAEMARLMGISLDEMKQKNRIKTAQQCAQAWGHIVLLKGAHTVIAAPDGQVRVLPFANPILAVGGSGDVLAGVITSLLGQGLTPFDAANLGGYLHGAVGDAAQQPVGLLASDIADLIPEAVKSISIYSSI